MKFISAIIIYLVLGALLGGGIFLLTEARWWLFVVALLVFFALFIKFGCLPPKTHH